MGFDGFISYSHAADGRLAPAVQRGLQSLAKPWHRRRALWIFRDQTGLAVTPALWTSITKALDSSEYFVLMASPEAANSPWVNKEIEHWVATRSPDKILPVVTDGDWRWDAERGDFADDSTAVPAALRGVFTEEPLYLDLRWARDEGQLSLRHSRFRDGIAQLAAPMHGISKDDLEGEDVRQHRRARRLWSVAAASLALLTLVASLTGVLAVRNADRANASAAEALRQQLRASQQEVNAGRSAQEASVQLENARVQEAQAKAAVKETRRQQKRAEEQRELADRASADAARQQANARRQAANAREQQLAAERAAKRAREQEALARQQAKLARMAAAESRTQKKIAEEQARLAREAKDEAEQQKQAAQLQKRLADKAAAEARRQEEYARKQQRLAEEAAAEARQQKDNAEQQQRIAIGRRLNNEAKAIVTEEPKTALMLGTAAAKVQPDDEARRQLAGLVTSTRYAGVLDDVKRLAYSTPDVLLVEDRFDRLTLRNVANRADPTLLADLGIYGTWALSPDGRTLAAATLEDDSAIVLLDVTRRPNPEVIATIQAESSVFNITFSQNGHTLFLGTWDLAAKDLGDLWDVSDLRRPKVLAQQFGGVDGVKFVSGAAFSPDGHTLVTQHDDRSTGVWDLTEQPKIPRLATLDEPLGDEQLNAMAFLRDAPILVSGGHHQTLLIDMSTPAEPKRTVTMRNEGGPVSSVIVSSDGSRLVTGDHDGSVTLFDLGGSDPVVPRQVDTLRDPDRGEVAALSPDGRTIVTVDLNSIARQWNVTAYGAPKSWADLTGSGEQGLAAGFTPDGRSLLTVGSNPQAAVWDVTRPSGPVRRATPTVHDKEIFRAALTPDGRILAAADPDGRVRVSDMTDPAQPVTVAEFVEEDVWHGPGNEITISPDGRTVALGGTSHMVVLWDVTRGRAATRVGSLPDSRMPMAFSPDSRTLAAVVDSTDSAASLWTWDDPAGPARLKDLGTLGRTTIQTIAFSPDGHTVAMAGDSAAALWDVSRARPRQSGKFTNPAWASAIAFSRDGRTVAIVNQNQAELWDLAHRDDPVKVAAIRLETQSNWSSRMAATFNPDGHTLTTGGADFVGSNGTATLWDLTELAELRARPSVQACAMTGRGLTEDEWARYIPELPHQSTCPG